MTAGKKPQTLVQLGKNLRSLRARKGWSQEKLAAVAGLDRTYVGGIERGERNVAVLNLAKLAAALGVNPCEMLKGIQPDQA